MDGEIKGKEWEEIRKQQLLLSLFKDEHAFRRAKSGVGEDTIKNFLGENWSLRRIREALAALHAPTEEFDRKAAEKLKSVDDSLRKDCGGLPPLPRGEGGDEPGPIKTYFHNAIPLQVRFYEGYWVSIGDKKVLQGSGKAKLLQNSVELPKVSSNKSAFFLSPGFMFGDIEIPSSLRAIVDDVLFQVGGQVGDKTLKVKIKKGGRCQETLYGVSTPGPTRTGDLRIRNPSLYPPELQGQLL